jgi:hypothetical protein
VEEGLLPALCPLRRTVLSVFPDVSRKVEKSSAASANKRTLDPGIGLKTAQTKPIARIFLVGYLEVLRREEKLTHGQKSMQSAI